MRKLLVVFAAAAFLSVIARAQDDAPSLGDVARQARAQKQKTAAAKDSKDATKPSDAQNSAAASTDSADSKTAHVITNEELPSHTAPKTAATHSSDSNEKEQDAEPPSGDRDAQAEQWKQRIQGAKESIASLQHAIDEVTASIHYVGGNCVSGCEQWNEHQQQKQQQVDSMKSQLEQAKHQLEEMQDAARKQGFGSSVYD